MTPTLKTKSEIVNPTCPDLFGKSEIPRVSLPPYFHSEFFTKKFSFKQINQAHRMKKIGILTGMERSFPDTFIERVNSKKIDGIVAEYVRIDKVAQAFPQITPS